MTGSDSNTHSIFSSSSASTLSDSLAAQLNFVWLCRVVSIDSCISCPFVFSRQLSVVHTDYVLSVTSVSILIMQSSDRRMHMTVLTKPFWYVCRVPSRWRSVCSGSSPDRIHCLARGSHDLHERCQCDCTCCGPCYWAFGSCHLPCCYSSQWDHLHQSGMGLMFRTLLMAQLFTPFVAVICLKRLFRICRAVYCFV